MAIPTYARVLVCAGISLSVALAIKFIVNPRLRKWIICTCEHIKGPQPIFLAAKSAGKREMTFVGGSTLYDMGARAPSTYTSAVESRAATPDRLLSTERANALDPATTPLQIGTNTEKIAVAVKFVIDNGGGKGDNAQDITPPATNGQHSGVY
jgi:hypothetical protein